MHPVLPSPQKAWGNSQMKPTKTASVARNELGQVVKGSGAINPGGITADERKARDAVRKLLATEGDEGLRDEGIASYRALLKDRNPAITIDFMNRLLGPVKARLSIEDEDGNAVSPLALMLAQFRTLPREAQETIELELAAKARDGA